MSNDYLLNETKSGQLTPHEALIHVMVTMAAVDRDLSDNELELIGYLTTHLPVFKGFDREQLVPVAENCGDVLSHENGLENTLRHVKAALPERLYETAYALAVEVAAADLKICPEELRLLEMLRDRFGLDDLVCAAIERSARARYRLL